jgi:DNA modification methylase
VTQQKIRQLKSIDWEFADYRGFSSFPADINSLHWYPAPFVPQIPAILIQALTEQGDLVFDPFAGVGVSLIEAVRLRRKPLGIDINPFAVKIVQAKFLALDTAGDRWISAIENDVHNLPEIEVKIEEYCRSFGVNEEVLKWFEEGTLRKLCTLHHYVTKEQDHKSKLLKEVFFSSILQKCCSQREHYTYVTDGCFPKELSVKADVKELFLHQARLIAIAAESFRKQYKITYGEEYRSPEGVILVKDARDLGFLEKGSVDMIVTSPPYVGVNDYVKSMRLASLFFPQILKKDTFENEIGARSKRNRKKAYEEYIGDMEKVADEISRVLKPSGFLCLTIGQGLGKVNRGNVKEKILQILQTRYKFRVEAAFSRKIKFKRIQIAGVENEEIVILNREPR